MRAGETFAVAGDGVVEELRDTEQVLKGFYWVAVGFIIELDALD